MTLVLWHVVVVVAVTAVLSAGVWWVAAGILEIEWERRRIREARQ